MRIVFAGGGTGGHLLPIIAVARELRRIYTGGDLELFHMGPKDEFGDLLLSQEGIKAFRIDAGKIRRYWSLAAFFQNFVDVFFKTPWSMCRAFQILFFLSPDLVFSKGGYGAFPATLASRVLRVPLFLHESDIVPGRANRWTSKGALEIFTSFPHTAYFPPKKVLLVGNPIRPRMLTGSRKEADQLFQLVGDKPLLLMLGGSQGASRINDMVLAVVNEVLSEFEIILQTGKRNFEQVEKEARVMVREEQLAYWHPAPFLNEAELRHAYAACDFVVSRAGSGVIFEIAALGKPSILIPLPESAQNHQVENAYAYAKTGAAVVLEEANMKPHFFLERVRGIVFDSEEMEKMRSAAFNFAKPEAAHVVADYLLAYLAR